MIEPEICEHRSEATASQRFSKDHINRRILLVWHGIA